jgi:hypothetical protein
LLLICQFEKKAQVSQIQTLLKEFPRAKTVDAILWAFSNEEGTSFKSWVQAIEKKSANCRAGMDG